MSLLGDIGGGIVGMATGGLSLLGGSGLFGTSQGTTPYTNTNTPWKPIQPYLTGSFAAGQNLFNQNLFSPSPLTAQATDMYASTARDPNSLTNQSMSGLQATIRGDYLDPSTNPHLRNVVNQALGQAGTTFASQYGGNAGTNLSNTGYQEALAKNLGETAIPFYADAYARERQNQLQAMQVAPALDYSNAGALAHAGQMEQHMAQMPWQNLAAYQASLMGGLPQFGTMNGQQPYYQNNTATTLGALAGAGGAFMGMKR